MGSEGVSSRKHHQSKHCETEWGAGVWNTEKQIPSARLSENSYFLKYTFTLAQENTPSKKERERERERKLTTLVLRFLYGKTIPKFLKKIVSLKDQIITFLLPSSVSGLVLSLLFTSQAIDSIIKKNRLIKYVLASTHLGSY